MTKRSKNDLPQPRCIGFHAQPISFVEWVKQTILQANSYNPNHIPPIELQLLRISLLSDGWTQPLIVNGLEIVDGFHRWKLSFEPDIKIMTDGLVPIVQLEHVSRSHQMMSTLRYARGRGGQGVVRMAELVRSLIDEQEMTHETLMTLLQMEREEIERLYDRGGIVGRAGKETFNKGWIPE